MTEFPRWLVNEISQDRLREARLLLSRKGGKGYSYAEIIQYALGGYLRSLRGQVNSPAMDPYKCPPEAAGTSRKITFVVDGYDIERFEHLMHLLNKQKRKRLSPSATFRIVVVKVLKNLELMEEFGQLS